MVQTMISHLRRRLRRRRRHRPGRGRRRRRGARVAACRQVPGAGLLGGRAARLRDAGRPNRSRRGSRRVSLPRRRPGRRSATRRCSSVGGLSRWFAARRGSRLCASALLPSGLRNRSGIRRFAVSLTHEPAYAAAVVVATQMKDERIRQVLATHGRLPVDGGRASRRCEPLLRRHDLACERQRHARARGGIRRRVSRTRC